MKFKLASLIAALSLLAACSSSHQDATESPSPGAGGSASAAAPAILSAPEDIGKALVYVPFPGNVDTVVSAALTLPEVSTNSNWYCNFVMIVGYLGHTNTQSFVEFGEMRRPGVYVGERTFVSWQGPDEANSHYEELGALSNAEHSFSLENSSGTFTARVDGGEPFTIPETIEIPRSYAQVGPEIFAAGDTLTGSVRALTTAAGDSHKSFDDLGSTCRTNDEGLSLHVDGDTLTAGGTYDKTKPEAFIGDCSWF